MSCMAQRGSCPTRPSRMTRSFACVAGRQRRGTSCAPWLMLYNMAIAASILHAANSKRRVIGARAECETTTTNPSVAEVGAGHLRAASVLTVTITNPSSPNRFWPSSRAQRRISLRLGHGQEPGVEDRSFVARNAPLDDG
jgi:hypothetical protein